MKRFWLVLLSLGLVMAFSVSAFAVDVKVSGEYYAAGMYLNKINVNNNTIPAVPASAVPKVIGEPAVPSDVSTAFFFQRLRIGTDFVVSPCLKLVTRFDAMERIWGGARSGANIADAQSAGSREENQNIAFDLAYIDYTSPVGLFRVGYQPDYEWGTVFGNRTSGPTAGQITYILPIGPVILVGQYAKETDKSASAVTTDVTTTDRDYDSYRLGAIYKFSAPQAKGEVGSLLLFNRFAEDKANTYTSSGPTPPYPPAGTYDVGYLTNIYKVIPYFKTQFGPVAFQGEFEYTFGNAVKAESSALGTIGHQPNVDISAWSVFLDATVNLGMVYFGGSFVYLSADDPNTDKFEGGVFHGVGVNTAGLDWNPCLIMFNTIDTQYWVGSINSYNSTAVDNEMSNAYFFQGRVGVKPIPQLDLMTSASYAMADRKPAGFSNDSYGWEIDVTGTYKITNNLSYMLGGGYLFTGNYFKGTNSDRELVNDYMLINKLTLSF
jgi:hypothetical protein